MFDQSLALHQQLGDSMRVAFTLTGMAHVARGQSDLAGARALYLDALQRHRDLGNDEGVIEALEGLSVLAAMQKDFARAARLFAALQTARAARGLALSPFERAAHEAAMSEAQAALEAHVFAAASEEGERLGLERAAEAALG
jgi:hypothetical protein